MSRPLSGRGLDAAAAESADLEGAWRALLAARETGVMRDSGGRDGAGIDRSGRLLDAAAELDDCVLRRGPAGWTAAAGITAAEADLLDLYLPVCNASAERPFTLAHLGQSLDGYIATDSGDSYYVTGPANVLHLHRMRALCAAVIVGAETVALDDPRLTVRRVAGPNPLRVVLDPRRRLGPDFRIFTGDEAATLLISAEDRCEGTGLLHGRAEVIGIPAPAGRLALETLLDMLHGRGMYSVFVEGGGATVSHFLQADLLDRLQIAVAPLVTGHGRPGIRLVARHHLGECLRPAHKLFRMGGDMLFDCDLRTPAPPPGMDGFARVY